MLGSDRDRRQKTWRSFEVRSDCSHRYFTESFHFEMCLFDRHQNVEQQLEVKSEGPDSSLNWCGDGGTVNNSRIAVISLLSGQHSEAWTVRKLEAPILSSLWSMKISQTSSIKYVIVYTVGMLSYWVCFIPDCIVDNRKYMDPVSTSVDWSLMWYFCFG